MHHQVNVPTHPRGNVYLIPTVTIMPSQLIIRKKLGFAVFWLGLLAANLTATPCRGADKIVANSTITLDIKNEPLRRVLEKITKTTRWKIRVPDKWLDRPVTQALHKVALAEGLRSVLRNAGVENLLLLYDEEIKTIVILDTESASIQSADHPLSQAPVTAQPPVVSASDEPDSGLQRPVRTGRARVSRRARRQSSEDD